MHDKHVPGTNTTTKPLLILRLCWPIRDLCKDEGTPVQKCSLTNNGAMDTAFKPDLRIIIIAHVEFVLLVASGTKRSREINDDEGPSAIKGSSTNKRALSNRVGTIFVLYVLLLCPFARLTLSRRSYYLALFFESSSQVLAPSVYGAGVKKDIYRNPHAS
jgi:hypothetical protein